MTLFYVLEKNCLLVPSTNPHQFLSLLTLNVKLDVDKVSEMVIKIKNALIIPKLEIPSLSSLAKQVKRKQFVLTDFILFVMTYF